MESKKQDEINQARMKMLREMLGPVMEAAMMTTSSIDGGASSSNGSSSSGASTTSAALKLPQPVTTIGFGAPVPTTQTTIGFDNSSSSTTAESSSERQAVDISNLVRKRKAVDPPQSTTSVDSMKAQKTTNELPSLHNSHNQ